MDAWATTAQTRGHPASEQSLAIPANGHRPAALALLSGVVQERSRLLASLKATQDPAVHLG